MFITTVEPAFLVPGLDSGCAPPGPDPPFTAVELVSVLGVAVFESVFGVAGLELVGPPVNSDCAGALAGKASITTKKGTITRLRKCLRKATKHMSSPSLRRDQHTQHYHESTFLSRREWLSRSPDRRSAERAVLLNSSGADFVWVRNRPSSLVAAQARPGRAAARTRVFSPPALRAPI